MTDEYTIEPDEALKSNVHEFISPNERFTARHVMNMLRAESESDSMECLMVFYRRSKTKQVAIAVSEDLSGPHLAVYAQVVQKLAQETLGLVDLANYKGER